MFGSSFQKRFLILCLFIIMLQFFSLSYFVLAPVARAQSDYGTEQQADVIAKLNIKILDLPMELQTVYAKPCQCTEGELADEGAAYCQDYATKTCISIPWISQYISAVYRYGVVLGSVIAVISLMAGGLMYVLGGFNQTMLSKGKEMMVGAVMGLVLLLGSYMILNIINPNLVKLKPITVAVNKEVKITNVTFCNELKPAKNYKFEPDSATCGAEVKFTNTDTSIKESGTCIATKCPETKMWCMPLSRKEVNKYTCRAVQAWGYIKDSEERYLDALYVNTLEGNTVKPFWSDDTYGKGDKVYWIDNVSGIPSAISDVVLGIELNDTGKVYTKEAFGDTIGGLIVDAKSAVNLHGTKDDDYYVGRGEVKTASDGKEYYTGVWTDPHCSNICLTIKPKGENAWMTEPGKCKFFHQADFIDIQTSVSSGFRVDIDAAMFKEDGDIDCKVWEKQFPAPTKKVGEQCGTDIECISNDCENEGGSNRCECNDDTDCNKPEEGIGTGNVCVSSLAVWNHCIKGKLPGEDCGQGDNDDVCFYKDCQCYTIDNKESCKCECNGNEQCSLAPLSQEIQYKELGKAKKGVGCDESYITWNVCKQCVEPDADGEKNAPAQGNKATGQADCCPGSVYNVNGSCKCNSDDDCSAGEYCYEDWGYCYKQKEVLELCTSMSDGECKSGSCKKDNWYDVGTEEWRCQCKKDPDCGDGKKCISVDSGCGWNYCIAKNKFVPAVPEWYGPDSSGYDVKNYPYKGLCYAPGDKYCGAGSDCATNWGANDCNACKGTLAESEKEGTECIGSCSGNSLMCTDSFKKYFNKQKNICVSVKAPIFKKCAKEDDCNGGGWNNLEGSLIDIDVACDNGICDCTENKNSSRDGCAEGYICANNLDNKFYSGNDMCVKAGLYDEYWE